MGLDKDEAEIKIEKAPPLEEQQIRKEAQIREDLPCLRDELIERGCRPQLAGKLLAMWSRSYWDYIMTECMEYWQDWMEARMFELEYRMYEGPELRQDLLACHKEEHKWLHICVRKIYKLPVD